MRTIIAGLGILILFAAPATAGRNANGAMVLHTDDAVSYSIGWDYCAEATPTDCVGMTTMINKDPTLPAMIWVLAYWCPQASPGLTAFQFGIYGDVPFDYFLAYGPCGPPVTIEIPDETWPAPGTGTAVGYGTPVYPAGAMKMYWFAAEGETGWELRTGNYPHGDMHAEFADDSQPPLIDFCYAFGTVRWGSPGSNQCPDCGPPPEACCLPDGSCWDVPPEDCTASGGVPYGPGSSCDQIVCPAPEACCFPDGSCWMLLPEECAANGGVPYGPGSSCDPNPCVTHFEACCFPDGHCEDMIYGSGQCANEGGIGQGFDTRCYQVACPPAEACCFVDGHCEMLTVDACNAAGGHPEGEGTTCESVECAPTPTKTTTWGRIKTSYR